VKGVIRLAKQSTNYATFWQRFLAVIIDAIIVGFVVGFLSGMFGFRHADGSYGYSNPFGLLAPAYAVFMLVKYGATLGKMAMGIRVQNESTGKNLTVVEAILRELVGKFVSSIALGLGYFWMLWDPKKQTWHDKFAKSIVVKIK
jgi:uncharacterized RDD family membrane protein YckC